MTETCSVLMRAATVATVSVDSQTTNRADHSMSGTLVLSIWLPLPSARRANGAAAGCRRRSPSVSVGLRQLRFASDRPRLLLRESGIGGADHEVVRVMPLWQLACDRAFEGAVVSR